MVVEVRIKNMKSEDVNVDIQDTSLSVTAKLAVGNTFYNILGTGTETGRKLRTVPELNTGINHKPEKR